MVATAPRLNPQCIISSLVSPQVAIIGAGIAGLSAAVALELRGWGSTIEIYERAPALRTDRGALLLWSNALAALAKLGLKEATIAAGQVVERTEFRSWDGRLLWALPVARLGRRVGQPSVVIRRSRLLELLAARAPGPKLSLGWPCLGVRQSERVVYLRFEGRGHRQAEFVIGADGVNSAIRAEILGLEVPRSTHQVAWIGTVAYESPMIPEGRTVATVGPGLRFNAMALGEGEVFWHATVPDFMADRPRTRAQLVALFRGGHPSMAEMIATTPETAMHRTVIQDRRPVSRWSEGRIVLVGDAAHPVTPDLGQGACQALEDATALSESFAVYGGTPDALQAFARSRQARTARIAERSYETAVLSMVDDAAWCAARDWGIENLLPLVAEDELEWMLRG